ncbi:MAG: histidine kinase [Oscillospiraceae bacterium]|nr:histidine kinase [Oscillospiraceae bacterium]
MPSIWLAIGLCVMLFALSLVVTLPVMQGISRPIASLQQVMETAAAGDLEVRADETGEDELSKLGGYFNHMLAEIKNHTENRVRLEVAELNLKQSLLMSQVNYHFIYNTMSTINALARRQDYERIQQVNSALADILQNNMLVFGYSMTGRLADELNTARQYWIIESISRRGTAELSIDCPDELLSCTVPKSILQPLVENSLRHGLIDAETGRPAGRVEITVSAQEDKLSIQVADNGRGMDSETLNRLRTEGDERISSGRHIGIANIRKRLEYLYGDRAVMEIDSSPAGTVIRLFIPYQG